MDEQDNGFPARLPLLLPIAGTRRESGAIFAGCFERARLRHWSGRLTQTVLNLGSCRVSVTPVQEA